MRKAQPSDDYTKFDQETGEVVHTPEGAEIPDPNPMQPPLGYVRQDPIAVRVREMIVGERLRLEALAAGAETFEEADDFEVGDDWEAEKHSPYEANFDPMTPEERAALSSQGKDTERSLTLEEREAFTPKPRSRKKADDDDQSASPPTSRAVSASSPGDD